MRISSNAFTSKDRRTGMLLAGMLIAALIVGCNDSSGPDRDNDRSPTEPGVGTGAGPGGHGPAPLALGSAGNYAILTKVGISNVNTSSVTGDIGVSPGLSGAITGFGIERGDDSSFATSDQVTGNIYASDYADPTPDSLTAAIGRLDTAYTDAMSRSTPDHTNLSDGDIGGMRLPPGLYKWTTAVTVDRDLTLEGGPNDVWILQIVGNLTMEQNTRISLTGGAKPENVFWQVGGDVTLQAESHIEGMVLAQGSISLGVGASANGRLFSNTIVSLNTSTVVSPTVLRDSTGVDTTGVDTTGTTPP